MITITNHQARQFILHKHGLLGQHRFIGKQGAYDYVRQCGCIQFDPVDACGRNAEIVLQSRVKGFTKQMLYDLLYTDRKLVDYHDKCMCIIPTDDWAYFARSREANSSHGRSIEQVNAVCEKIKDIIRENGAVSSSDLDFSEKVHWYWSDTKLSRAALETMYFRGDLIVHHKKGAVKYYDLAEKHIPAEVLNASDPLPDEFEHQKWRVLRRIGAVGLLWNRPSDAWLNIWKLKTPQRKEVFSDLLKKGEIAAVQVEGLKDILYCCAKDLPLIEMVMQNERYKSRCELIAPLDCMMWDRKLIKALFGFEYSWEIYTPADKRKYGFYVLPMIYGDQFIGRVEAVNDRKTKTLNVENIWYEDRVRRTKALLSSVEKCLKRFAKFNECSIISYSDKFTSDMDCR